MNATLKIILSITVILLSKANVLADDFRIFQDLKGRSIEGRLIEYQPRNKTVKIQLQNKAVKTVKASIFSDADQQYIADWAKASSLFGLGKLKVSAEKELIEQTNLKGKSYNGVENKNDWHPVYAHTLINKKTAYLVRMSNKSEEGLKGIQIEYCIYYTECIEESKSTMGYEGNSIVATSKEELPGKEVLQVVNGNYSISNLKQGKTEEMQTKSFVLKSGRERKEIGLYESERKTESDLAGIIIRVHVPLQSEDTIMKEYRFPKDLGDEFQWTSK
jgi:hypothetical protein